MLVDFQVPIATHSCSPYRSLSILFVAHRRVPLRLLLRIINRSQNPSSHILRIEHGGRVFQAQPLRRLLVNSLNSQLSRLAVTSAVIRKYVSRDIAVPDRSSLNFRPSV